MMRKNFWRRFASWLSIVSLLANSILPYSLAGVAYAQESTASATLESPDPTATPSATPEASPEVSPEPTPEATPSAIPSASPEVSPEPTPEATPSAKPEASSSATPEPSTESANLSETKIPLRKAGDFLKETKKQTNKNYVEGEVIVKFKKEKVDVQRTFGKAQAFVFEKQHSLDKQDEIKSSNIQVFKSKKSTEEMVNELKSDPKVEYAQPNFIYEPTTINTNDTKKDLLWGLDNTGQTVEGTYSVHTGIPDKDIDAPEAWEISEGNGTIVAVIDNGVAYNHPDLVNSMWNGSSCKDDNGNFLGGCNSGIDYADGDKIPLPTNDSHGTHIAGTIAAEKNNGKGIIGVAPSTKIMAIRTNYSSSQNIKGINFAKQNGAKIINASWACYGSNQGGVPVCSTPDYDDFAMIDAINNFPGLVITAAGNGRGDEDDEGDNHDSGQTLHAYPCDHTADNIICVAATDQNDNLASFSDYGVNSVDIGAPGTNIHSTITETEVLNETFSEVTAPNIPNGWVKAGTNNKWATYDFGSNKVLYGQVPSFPYDNETNSTITSTSYNLSDNTSGANFNFDTSCDTEYDLNYWTDYMALEFSGDNGNTFTQVLKWDEPTLDSDTDPSGGASFSFTDFSIESQYLTTSFKFRLRWFADPSINYYDGCSIDNIIINKYVDGSEEYGYMNGTSMAVSHVAGLAALIWGYKPNLTQAQVKDRILQTGDDISALHGKTFAGTRINAYKALNDLNNPPTTNNGSTSTNEDTAKTITFSGSDVDGDSLTYSIVSSPAHGTLGTISGNQVTYIPSANYVGSDTFTFKANDGIADSNTSTVSITVNPVNDTPVANNGSATTSEDTLVTIVLLGSDVDGNPLTYSIVSGVSHGTLGTISDNQITYTPSANYVGSDSFTFKANDGTIDSNTATVTITVTAVNDPPVLDTIGNKTVNELATLAFTATATDPDSTLTYSLTNAPTGATIDPSTGVFSFTPTETQGPNTYPLTVSVTDGTSTDSEQITITVNEVNVAPIANDGSSSTNEDTAKTITLGATDADIPAQTLTYSIVSGVSHGTLSNLTGNHVDYTPSANYTGADSFTFKVNDGTADSNTATISITVSPINDAPTANDDTASVNEDETLTIAKSTLLANDTDIEGNSLTLTAVSTPTHGTVSISGDNVIFTPTANYNGSASFDYTVSDGTLTDTGTVNITVNPINDSPSFDPIADQSVNEDSLSQDIAITNVLPGSSDESGQIITMSATSSDTAIIPNPSVTGSGSTRTLTYTPAANKFGSVTITVIANDGQISNNTYSRTFTITVNSVNDAPVANSDTASVNEDETLTIVKSTLLANDTDVEGNGLTISAVSNSIHGSVVINGDNVIFTPTANYNGSASFDYTISDGSLADTTTVSITVIPVNDAPVANPQSVTTDEDNALLITLSGSDIDNDSLTYSIISGVGHGVLGAISGNQLTYTPNTDYNGADSFTFSVSDGTTDSIAATVNITVTAINDAPVGVADSASVNEDEVLSLTKTALLANDTDMDGDSLTLTAVSNPVNGTVEIDGTNFIFTPSANYFGSASFDYTVSDGSLTDTATVNITVNSVNDLPVANNGSATTSEDTLVTINLSAIDVDGDSLSYSIVTGVGHGTLTNLTNNHVDYTPSTNYNGADSFTFKANDGNTDSNTATVSITVTAVNDSPVLDPIGNKSVDELNTLTFTATATDPDNTLTYSLTNAPAGASINPSTGVFSFTPTEAQGPDSYTLTINVTDGTTTDSEEITITVNEVNVVPVALDNSITTNEDTAKTITLGATDTDIPSQSLTYSIVSGVSHGILGAISGNQLTYTPNVDYNGADSFTFKVNDGITDSNTATISITVNPINDAPAAVDDTVSVDEDTVLTIAKSTLLSNDADTDGDSLSLTAVSSPVNGSVSISGNNVIFTATTNYSGSASFDYIISDGNLTDTATVNITVNSVNDAPVLDPIGNKNIDEFSTLNLTISASDIDNQNLQFTTSSLPTNASFDSVNKTFTFTPDETQGGQNFQITFTVSDGILTDSETITITVNEVNSSPVAVNDNASVNEDEVLTVNVDTLLANDYDLDTNTNVGLTITAVNTGVNGTVNLNGTTVTFTPNANFNGTASFKYIVSDGSLTDTGTINITVNSVNDAPVLESIGNKSIDEYGTLNFTVNATDVDNASLSFTAAILPANSTFNTQTGAFQFTPNESQGGQNFQVTFTVSDGELTDDETITITVNEVNNAPVAQNDQFTTDEDSAITINHADLLSNDSDPDNAQNELTVTEVSNAVHGTVSISSNNVIFTPTANYFGPASFDYTVSDDYLTDTATVNITINPVNDAPVVNNGSTTTNEDTLVTINLSASDIDGNSLTYSIVSGVSHGILGEISGNQLTYTPTTNYTGADSFTFKANDGNTDSNIATVSITVTAVNDPPVLDPIGNKTVNELATLSFTVTATDPDNTLTYSLTNAPTEATIDPTTGAFSFTPTESQGPGSYTLTIKVTDGVSTDSEEITITVNEVNVAPVASDNSVTTNEDTAKTIKLGATDTDLPSQSLTYSIVSGVSHGVLGAIINNQLTYTPNADYNGADSFTFKANDGATDSNTTTISITVNPVNDTPVANDDTASVDEDTTLTIAKTTMLSNDSDIDGESLTLISVSNPTNGSVVISGNNVIFTPTANYFGSASFDYLVSDGNLTDTATVSITINSVNDNPVANNGSATTLEDTLVTIDLSASDVDGDSLSYSIVSGVGHGVLNNLTNNHVDYTPSANYTGADSFTFKANDGNTDSNTAIVNITVTAVNDSPVLDQIGNKTVNELATLAFTATATDPDSSFTYSLTNAPTGASINPSTGVFSFIPTEAQGPGSYTLTIEVTDGTSTDSEEITITVNEVNVAPVANDGSVSTNEDTSKTITLTATDVDIPSQTLTYSIVSGVSHGTLSNLTANQVNYTPSANYNGPDSFTFKANDGTADSNTATISITVNPVNDEPVANDDIASVNEDETLTIAKSTLLVNDTDVDGDSLSLTAVSNPSHGTVSISGDNVIFTPTANYFGPASFDYTVSDGSLTDTATVSITVNPVNDAPVANDDSVITSEDTLVTIDLSASDVDGDSLTYSIVSGVSHGVLSNLNGNQVDYTPGLNYTGADSFTFKANDGTLNSNTATISITVNPPPTISNETTNTPSETSITITWTTDHPSTSRVIYDIVSHAVLGVAPNYGYANSTVEADSSSKVTAHSVTISGLTAETTYYYRVVSHGSPEVVGDEKSFTTENKTSSGGEVAGTSTTSSTSSVCSDQKPASAPTLVSIIQGGSNEVTLIWSKAKDPVTYYLIAFGTKSGEMLYGNPYVGGENTTSYTVKGLSSGTKYFFKVRAGNNCMPGDFSNELSTSVYGQVINEIPEGFAQGVLGEKTSGDIDLTSKDIKDGLKETNKGAKQEILGVKKSTNNIKYLLALGMLLGIVGLVLRKKQIGIFR